MECIISIADIESICQLIKTNLSVPVSVRTKEDLIKEYTDYPRKHPTADKEDIHKELINQIKGIRAAPVIHSLNDIEYYLSLQIKTESSQSTYFILGPFLLRNMNDDQLNRFMNKYQIPYRMKSLLYEYFTVHPVCELNKIKHMGQLLHFLLLKKHIDIKRVVSLTPQTNETDTLEDIANLYMTVSRSKEKIHHDNLYESKIVAYIREGKYKELNKFLKNTPPLKNLGTVAQNPIRNEKNLAITVVALASRASIEGGLNTEIAYSLSDMYIQKIEEDTHFFNFRPIANDIFLDYAYRVYKVKQTIYSKPIIDAQSYIYNHIYKKMDLDTLASQLYLNPKYLSRLFKQEVGLSISEYIAIEKIKEAKKWLKHSNLHIADISTQLNFYDQSHFSRVFKSIEGVSPKKYRMTVK